MKDLKPKIVIISQLGDRMTSSPRGRKDVSPPLKYGTNWQWPGLHLGEKLCFAGNTVYLHDAQWCFLRRGCRSSTWTQHLGEGLQHVEVVGPVQGLKQRKTNSGATGLGGCCRRFNREKNSLRQELWKSSLTKQMDKLNQEIQTASGYPKLL